MHPLETSCRRRQPIGSRAQGKKVPAKKKTAAKKKSAAPKKTGAKRKTAAKSKKKR